MLRTLIWKDVLATRFQLVLAASLLVASYGAAATLVLLDPSQTAQPWRRQVAGLLLAGCLMSHAVAQLSLAVLSGNLIAGERANRSAEFLAYLPPSRGMVLRAKATVLGILALLLLLIPLGITGLGALFPGGLPWPTSDRAIARTEVFIWAMGFCASGIGWLASCCLQSNAVAILFALFSPFILATLIRIVIQSTESTAILLAANFSIGLAGFLIGTIHYLNRVEP